MTTIFSQIIAGNLPAEKVFENETLIAIKDIHPVAPVHILIIPKIPFKDLQSVPPEQMHVLTEVMLAAQHLAVELGIEKGYRLLTNNGQEAGQTIFHLHFHLIGGRSLPFLA